MRERTTLWRRSLWLMGAAILGLSACSDSNEVQNGAAQGTYVNFSLSGNDELTGSTRAAAGSEILSADLHKAASTDGAELFLLDKEEAWVDETAETRAAITTIATLGDFSSIGYHGASATSLSKWFDERVSRANGQLYVDTPWEAATPFGVFYGISPMVTSANSGISNVVAPASATTVPSLHFVQNTDGLQQKDLLVARSENRQYYTPPAAAEQVPLTFRHALTQIRFKMGYNLSRNQRITSVTIKNAASEGDLSFPTEATDAAGFSAYGSNGFGWTNVGTPAEFTMQVGQNGNPVVRTNTAIPADSILLGRDNDVYSLFMIPQNLAGIEIEVRMAHISTGNVSTFKIAHTGGVWRPGTRRTYTLNDEESDWEYVFDETPEVLPAVAYNATAGGNFTVTSYRRYTEYPSGTTVTEPIAWEVTQYEEWDPIAGSWENLGTTKPNWLTALSQESGLGGTSAATVTTTLQVMNLVDRMEMYNDVMRNTAAVGQGGTAYNLANPNNPYNDYVEESANSYLISAPGKYRLPLAYGNAIKNNGTNAQAFTFSGTLTGTEDEYVLQNFRMHTGAPITTGWITDQVAPNAAKVIWATRAGMVDELSFNINGRFLEFEVPATNFKNGNIVIAAMVDNGVTQTVVWSWNLWFAQEGALTHGMKEVANLQGKKYTIGANHLGTEWEDWYATTYDVPLRARITVKPQQGSQKTKVVTITKNNYTQSLIPYNVLFQFGRHSAIPSVKTDAVYNPNNAFVVNAGGGITLVKSIQNPGYYYTWGNDSDWTLAPNTSNPGNGAFTFKNLWSANNTAKYGDSIAVYTDNPVVKTVYDPCPAGWCIPANNTFTGMTSTGAYVASAQSANWNVQGVFNRGFWFYTDATKTDVLFFSCPGERWFSDGHSEQINRSGHAITAVPLSSANASLAGWSDWAIDPIYNSPRTFGWGVRPMKEQ